ncbi:MAG: hypothetical protein IH889_06850 [Planctomycetes bacterium]|nr:hypothetical protein [Planctomycetota bacterium]
MSKADPEKVACTLTPVSAEHFNRAADIPCGLAIEHIHVAMNKYLDFLGFVNAQLHTKQMPRLESFLMPANFSSMVGEFMTATIPNHCKTIAKNRYHNGHPDLLPKGRFPGDSIHHGTEGIEVKASRHQSGWQGHNPEDVWLMVFVFDANSSRDAAEGVSPKPFRFVKVVGAQLAKADWNFSGRSKTSRRTITASVTRTGFAKMEANWIYRAPA